MWLDPQLTVAGNALNFGKVPFLIAERTDGARLEPALDAVQVEDVSAVSKGNRQAVVVRRRRVGLVLNARFVQGISTNGALQEI